MGTVVATPIADKANKEDAGSTVARQDPEETAFQPRRPCYARVCCGASGEPFEGKGQETLASEN